MTDISFWTVMKGTGFLFAVWACAYNFKQISIKKKQLEKLEIKDLSSIDKMKEG